MTHWKAFYSSFETIHYGRPLGPLISFAHSDLRGDLDAFLQFLPLYVMGPHAVQHSCLRQTISARFEAAKERAYIPCQRSVYRGIRWTGSARSSRIPMLPIPDVWYLTDCRGRFSHVCAESINGIQTRTYLCKGFEGWSFQHATEASLRLVLLVVISPITIESLDFLQLNDQASPSQIKFRCGIDLLQALT